LVYWLVAGLYALNTPAWQAPDEPAHYNVVRQWAQTGAYPVITEGDWDAEYLAALTAARFAPDRLADLPAVQYEDHQPPLYYGLLVPVYQLSGGDLLAMRLASVAIGSVVVAAAYAIALRAYRGRVMAAAASAAFVALVPQHLHLLGSVNNDALAWALGAVALWLCLDHADRGRTPAWLIGLVVGLIAMTKTTAYLMAGVAVLAIALRAQTEVGQRWRTFVRRGLAFGLTAAPFALLWWGYNVTMYGFPDILGLRAHDAVVVGQLRTADFLAQVGLAQYAQTALQTTHASFWGMFGWMAAPLPVWAQAGLSGAVVLGAVGLMVWGRGQASRGAWPLMGLAGGLGVLMLVYYNTQFVQFQGRYAYALLIPLGVMVGVGLDLWRARLPVVRGWPWLTPALVTVGMGALAVWALLRVLVPQLTPQ
jgi:4-amino-4-deoxy-L-arabinose transferase-like glycosyltransferase